MSINFFNRICKTASALEIFGLCDDPPPIKNPAYIDEHNPSKWIATVHNNSKLNIDFYAIDHCPNTESYRANGDLENRCDGMLHFDGKIVFVELKDRAPGGWLGEGINQLIKTIDVFFANNISPPYKMEAYVSNKQHYLNDAAHRNEIQRFKDETSIITRQNGINLRVNRNIEITS